MKLYVVDYPEVLQCFPGGTRYSEQQTGHVKRRSVIEDESTLRVIRIGKKESTLICPLEHSTNQLRNELQNWCYSLIIRFFERHLIILFKDSVPFL